jgi:serine/threonine protein kinase
MIWSITQQLSSRYVLLLHLQYDVYDTVKPAIFYRGARVNLDNEGLLSPPTTPATSFPIDARLLLFLTSDIGEDPSGVLHDGVLEVEYDEKNSSTVPVIVKLAFTDEQQENLVQEWSVHMHMLSESVTGIQTVLGVFHEEEDEGPSCLVSCCTGTSLAERTSSLSPNQRYVFPYCFFTRGMNSSCRASFLANLCSIHKAGVLHGDVGLHSLFIKDSDDAIIANFGRARVVDTTEDELQAEYQSMCKLLDSIP